ncbi:MAG TPA: tripartite tricarboxylate transporter permease [Candidatus Thermoplasmatota archaeon]|nr:tripartite tricarboxylate transporter permease [Candidatus Thermoplasmatota archaeon]
MTILVELVLIAVIGALLGCVTGLIPSLHVNTLAVLLLGAAPILALALTAAGFRSLPTLFQVSALILAISVAHTFINIVPATFLGAPDETTALSVLPGHKMLLRGSGYHAVQLSAYASQWAVLASVVLVLPLKWTLGEPLRFFDVLQAHLFWIVLGVAVLLVATEHGPIGPETWTRGSRAAAAHLAGLALLLTTGVYGLLLDELPYHSLVPIPPSPLLPALSGLFGAATVVAALSMPPRLPHQFLEFGQHELRPLGAVAAMGAGVVAGATMSVLPGLTNASATAIATTLQKGNDEETIISLSAVNTANVVFNLAVLYLFHRSRSGAVIAMEELWPIRAWHDLVPHDLLRFGIVLIASGFASLLLTLLCGRLLVRRIQHVPYRGLLIGVLVYMALVVAVFTGRAGLLVALTGLALGLVPVRLGLRRTCLTGVLLVPVLVYFAPDFT